jgi:phosphoenolpyruvate carboxykinase (ATP)
VFGVHVPTSCPGVPERLLDPRSTWADPSAYDAQADEPARLFAANFEQFAGRVPAEVAAAGPRVAD